MNRIAKTVVAGLFCFGVAAMLIDAAAAGRPGFKGSLPYQGAKEDEQAMAAQARITSEQAAAIARRTTAGTVVETELEEESGYLVWEVEVVTAEGELKLKIDAGDGRVLGTEREEEGGKD